MSLPASLVRQLHQQLAVVSLKEWFGQLSELVGTDEASLEGSCFRASVKAFVLLLEVQDVLRCGVERLRRAGVEPVGVAVEHGDLETALFQVGLVDCRDLQLAACTGRDSSRDLDDRTVVEVHARNGVVRLRLRRLLLEGDGLAVLVKLHHTEVPRVAHVARKHHGTHRFLDLLERASEPVADEDVVTERQCDCIVADEVFRDDEGLRDAARDFLDRVRQGDAELRAIAEHVTILLDIVRRGNHEDVVDAGRNEIGQWVVQSGLVAGGDERLAHTHAAGADALGCRTEAGTLASGQNDSLQGSS